MSNNSEKHQEVWTLAEVRQGNIHPVSMELLAWGRSLADELGVDLASVVIGTGMREQVPLLFAGGADKVYLVDSPACLDFGAHPQSEVLIHLVQQYQPDILLASATTTGRTVMPYCAARLHTGLTADCTGLTIEPEEKLLIQTRPAIGGNVMATIKTPDRRPQMATVRPKSKRPLPPDATRTGTVVEAQVPAELLESPISRLEFKEESSVGVPLQDAEVIIAFGKGLKNEANLKMIKELAQLLGGSIGATRKAVDLGWATNSQQIGLSGKTVSPSLYVGFGISGAVQHLAGITSSEKVVAVNCDPEAPILQVADIGVIGDMFQILPSLIDGLKRQGMDG